MKKVFIFLLALFTFVFFFNATVFADDADDEIFTDEQISYYRNLGL